MPLSVVSLVIVGSRKQGFIRKLHVVTMTSTSSPNCELLSEIVSFFRNIFYYFIISFWLILETDKTK